VPGSTGKEGQYIRLGVTSNWRRKLELFVKRHASLRNYSFVACRCVFCTGCRRTRQGHRQHGWCVHLRTLIVNMGTTVTLGTQFTTRQCARTILANIGSSVRVFSKLGRRGFRRSTVNDRHPFFLATGTGLEIRTSPDRTAWTYIGNVWPTAPSATNQFTGTSNGVLWAPDCTYANNKFHVRTFITLRCSHSSRGKEETLTRLVRELSSSTPPRRLARKTLGSSSRRRTRAYQVAGPTTASSSLPKLETASTLSIPSTSYKTSHCMSWTDL
jgi:hypothetical protein